MLEFTLYGKQIRRTFNMCSFWFFGFVAYLLGRTFYAGLRSKDLFYREPKLYGETGRQLCEDKVAGYMLRTFGVSLTWPISLPLIGIFIIGQKLNKKEKSTDNK
jgi:hypothetical protein